MENNNEEIKENELVKEVINEPVNEPVKEVINEPVNEPVKDVVNEPSNEPVKEVVNEPSNEPVKEVVNEPVNNVENKVVNELLNKLIQKISQDKEFMNIINLDQKSLDVINLILKNHPKILENICNDIKNITQDKEISINDIPSIILLCKDIFNLYSESKKIKLTKIQIIEFIKNIIVILVKSNLIKR